MTQIGLVGSAHIHTPGFVNKVKARSDVTITKVWDPNPLRAQKRSAELDATVVSTPAEVWDDPQISGVIICSETIHHRELVLAGAGVGKNLFVEKPLGMGAKDSFAMARAIERAGVLFSTGYFQRGLGLHLLLKEHVDKGSFGQITRIRGSNCHSGALGDWFAPKPDNPADDWRWMADPDLAGVGAFGDLGTHSLDIMLWLLGDVASATACLAPGIRRYRNSKNWCDETGEGLLRFRNGAIGSLAAAWDDVANPVTLLISGTEAHATIVSGKLYFKCEKLGLSDDQPLAEIPPDIPAGLDAWLNAITGDTTAQLVTAREAAYRPAVMRALYKGHQKQRWIKPKTMD